MRKCVDFHFVIYVCKNLSTRSTLRNLQGTMARNIWVLFRIDGSFSKSTSGILSISSRRCSSEAVEI
ncbi:hypothetical protein RCL_jg24174.t1 [Rhizophagus clarus]|uniref:Uncharacterized protein n=1 Tax=Rhizophagus clarus TaxID=94130 RepID=A0A8H3LFA0_9GLOM|nr:hypothetical protein RCL_jg24174.t1 [Rhizophagus clarus]